MFVFVTVLFAWAVFNIKLHIVLAKGQIIDFSQCVDEVKETTNEMVLSNTLIYVRNYYPSGTKQARDSALDQIVESARSNAIYVLENRLRELSVRNAPNPSKQR